MIHATRAALIANSVSQVLRAQKTVQNNASFIRHPTGGNHNQTTGPGSTRFSDSSRFRLIPVPLLSVTLPSLISTSTSCAYARAVNFIGIVVVATGSELDEAVEFGREVNLIFVDDDATGV